MSTNASWQQAANLLTLVGNKGTPSEQIQKLYNSGLLADLLDANVDKVNRDEFRKVLGLVALEPRAVANAATYPSYTVPVDYNLSLPDMITAGHYDDVNDNITPERFPIQGSGKRQVTIALVHPGKEVESQPLIDEMDALGYRPATNAELLALGARYPELQREIPVIALGSLAEVRAHRRVMYLDNWDGKRKLNLHWFAGRWYEVCRFAFVKKD